MPLDNHDPEIPASKAARILGRSTTQVYNYEKAGRLPPARTRQTEQTVRRTYRLSDVEKLRKELEVEL